MFYYVFFDFKKARKSIYEYINRNNLNSSFYSNTSLASNFSIIFLLFSAYFISFYLLINFLNINFNYSDYANYYNLSNYYNLYTTYNGFLFNLSYLNWIVISLIIGFLFITWRSLFNIYLVLDTFNLFIIFSIIFYINYQFFWLF